MPANPAPGFAKHPQHTVDIHFDGKRRKIFLKNTLVADTSEAAIIEEGRYDPVVYVPRAAITDLDLTMTATTTYCPFKGEANYWALSVNGETINDGAWSYEAPYDECLQIKGFLAFYPDRTGLKVEIV